MTKIIENINKTKSQSFENVSKIDKPLAGLVKKNKERAQISKIRKKRGEVKVEPQKYKGS